jgi:WD40 repeat protein
VDVWDVESGQLLNRIKLNHEFRNFDFSADGLNLVGASFQGSVMSLDWPSGDVRLERTAHQSPATASVLLSAARAATTGHDGFVRIWDAETGAQVAELPPQESAQPLQGYALAASPDGRYVVVGGNSWAAIWDVSSGTRLHNLPFHPFSVKAVAISPDGRHVLTGGETGRVQLFQLDSGEFVRRFDKHADVVLSLEFLADGRQFVSGAMDGSLRVFSLDGEELTRRESRVNNVSVLKVSPDGRRIASAGGVRASILELPTDATLHLWELPQSLWPDEVGGGEGAPIE